VGDFYVRFSSEIKAEYKARYPNGGGPEEEVFFNTESELGAATRAMLMAWEAGDPAVMELWRTMNGWCEQGFAETYRRMGVGFDRVLTAFDGPFERLPYGQLQSPPPGRAPAAGNVAGFLLSPRVNDSFILVNRLLKQGAEVFRVTAAVPAAAAFGPGAIYVPDRGSARAVVTAAAAQLGLAVVPLAAEPPTEQRLKLAPVRVALWDRFGGSMPSGWTRWLLEQFEFPFEVVYPAQIDAGNLREKYDAIVLVGGALSAPGVRPPPTPRPRNLPPEFESWVGRLTPEHSVPALREFLQAGGSVVTIGSSTSLAYHLGLPLQSALTERNADGRLRNLPDDKFYIPGSILSVRVDPAQPVAWGLPERLDVYFDRSAVFGRPANLAGFQPVAWFDSDTPLRSGWAWGQKFLKDGVTLATIAVGPGKLYLFGSEVAFRGQTHGTFKLLFNSLQLATAKPAGSR
jgi:hypothetical protein